MIAFDRYIRIKRTYNVSSGSEEGRYSSVTLETLIIWIVGILLGTPGAYFVTLQPIRVNYSADQLIRDLSGGTLSGTTLRENFLSGVTLSDSYLSEDDPSGVTYQAFGNFLENYTYDENIEITHAQMLKLELTPHKLITMPTPTPPLPSPRSHRTIEKWAPYSEFGFTTFYRCTEVWPPYVRPIYSSTVFILQCILPAISLVVTSGLISKHLNASRMNLGGSSSDIDEQESDLHARNIQRNKSVTRTLLCVSVSFTLCWLPIHILNLLLDLEILKSPPIHPDTLYLYVAVALAIAMVSVPLNALLYGWFNPSINREVVAWKQRTNLIKMVGAFSPGGAAPDGPMNPSGTIHKSPPAGGATLKRMNESCINFTINLNDHRSASTNYLNYQNINYRDINYQNINYRNINYQNINNNFNYQNLNIARSVSDHLLASGRSSISASSTSFLFKKCYERDANLRDADQSGPAPSGSKRESPIETPILLASDPKARLSSPSSSSLFKHITTVTSCEDKSIEGQSPKGESSQHRIHREGAKLASSSNGGGKIFSRSKKLIGTVIVHEQISSV